MIVKANSAADKEMLLANKSFIERFCNPGELTIDTEVTLPNEVMSAIVKGAEIFLPLQGLVNVEEEIARLEKELDKWQSEINRAKGKLGNEKFVSNAPDAVVQAERDKQAEYEKRYEAVQEQISKLQELE